jgi:hypothetical protein
MLVEHVEKITVTGQQLAKEHGDLQRDLCQKYDIFVSKEV